MSTPIGVMHTCPDGTRSRLHRGDAPVGTTDVEITCPRCGYSRNGTALLEETRAALSAAFGTTLPDAPAGAGDDVEAYRG